MTEFCYGLRVTPAFHVSRFTCYNRAMAMKAEYEASPGKRPRLGRVRATAGLPGQPGRPALVILYAAIAIVVGLIGMLCVAVPCALIGWYKFSDWSPAVKDYAGVWAATPDSIGTMEQYGYRITSHVLNLRSDGSFEMSNIPDCVLKTAMCNGPGSHTSLVSGSGTWEIDADTGDVVLHIAELDGQERDLAGRLDVWQGHRPFALGFPIRGDPDGARVYFERQ